MPCPPSQTALGVCSSCGWVDLGCCAKTQNASVPSQTLRKLHKTRTACPGARLPQQQNQQDPRHHRPALYTSGEGKHSERPLPASISPYLSIPPPLPVSRTQVLNLENNELSKVPDTLGDLGNLQTLVLKGKSRAAKAAIRSNSPLTAARHVVLQGNKLKAVPATLGRLQRLRTLDLSGNQITRLPKELCQLRALETLIVGDNALEYPPPEVVAGSTADIMRFLCKGG